MVTGNRLSRNKVRNNHSLHWATVMQWIAIVMIVSTLGAGYVMMKNQVLRLASEVRAQEIELNGWKKRNQQIKCNLAQLTSLPALQQRLAALGSGLVGVGELQVIPMEGGRLEKTAIANSGVTR